MAAIYIKSKREIAVMREAGRIVAEILTLLREAAVPGRTTGELDQIAEKAMAERGATSAFKGYHGFPATLCASINDEIVHGIPNPGRILRDGDIISLDFGVVYQGFYGDSATTVAVGQISQPAQDLLRITEESLWHALRLARAGERLGVVSNAVQEYAESRGYGVVRQYCGHGIGRHMHEEPQIPNFGPPNRGPVLRAGMVLAIEPMLNIGTEETIVRPDNWTVVTADGSLSAHFEHSVAVTNGEPEILTLP